MTQPAHYTALLEHLKHALKNAHKLPLTHIEPYVSGVLASYSAGTCPMDDWAVNCTNGVDVAIAVKFSPDSAEFVFFPIKL
jgi:hypothetical protein